MLFTPPVVEGNALGGKDGDVLWRHYDAWAQGATVWKDQNGVWHQSPYPYQGGVTSTVQNWDGTVVTGPDEGLATAQKVYLGGHVYTLTDLEGVELAFAGYADRLNIEPIDVQWPGLDMSLWNRRVISQDGAMAFQLRYLDERGQGISTAGASVLASNQREWYTHQNTENWADSETHSFWDPVSFVPGVINPQCGIVQRATTAGGFHTGILTWSDVTFGSPRILNIGVWKTPSDGSAANFRVVNFNTPLGPNATNVFPYFVDTLLVGTTIKVRVYKPNQAVPSYNDPDWAITVDLNFGDTVTYPTPTNGGVGFWVAHSGTDPLSRVRYGNSYFRRLD